MVTEANHDRMGHNVSNRRAGRSGSRFRRHRRRCRRGGQDRVLRRPGALRHLGWGAPDARALADRALRRANTFTTKARAVADRAGFFMREPKRARGTKANGRLFSRPSHSIAIAYLLPASTARV